MEQPIINKLKARLALMGISVKQLCQRVGMSRNIWYRRCLDGDFKLTEIKAIASTLCLTEDDVKFIFFS